MNSAEMNNKPLGTVVAEMRDDLKDFLQTRFEMLRGELKEKIGVWKTSLPMLLIALVLAWSAFLAVTFALIAALQALFHSPFGWAFAAIIVAAFYGILASLIAWLAYREIQYAGVAPKKTMEVLKQDQIWLQNEARQQL